MLICSKRFTFALIVLFLFQTGRLYAIDAKDTASTADPDFSIQGEYLGDIVKSEGQGKLGVQVVAAGNGKFHAVCYDGGLPGEGWNKGDKRKCDGETVEEVTTFKDSMFTMTIKGGLLVVTGDGNARIGELQKVARQSPTLGAKPPEGAIVLFDGKNADLFENGRVAEDGFLMPGATSKGKFQSGTLHVEFRVPYGPNDATRGNSGAYLQSRYEVQILNSFGLEPHNHECGGIPSVRDPDVNLSFPPQAWQTYDVEFKAAEYKDGKKERNTRMTVRHNGVVVHPDVEVPHATTSSPLEEGPEPGPIYLQEHGGAVRYRNIWFAEKK